MATTSISSIAISTACARSSNTASPASPKALYQLGHPMGFQTQIYVGETHFCRPIFDRDGKLGRLKAMVVEYPEQMRVALVRKHLFDSAFHLEIAEKPAARADIIYVAQCLASATGFMTLVLYALNRQFFMNEKGAFLQSVGFSDSSAAFASTRRRNPRDDWRRGSGTHRECQCHARSSSRSRKTMPQ